MEPRLLSEDDMESISGNIVDIHAKRIFPGTISFNNGKITSIDENAHNYNHYILPGFVDAHVHIESSMITPYEFSRLSLPHGTIASVSDPHEIANVLGLPGIQFMLDNAKLTPFHICFGAPSCVPATDFETAGATITSKDIELLLDNPRIGYLREMMNYPGVLNRDPEVVAKIQAAKDRNKPIDGHAPGLTGQTAEMYASVGITTDHECFTLEEALDKIDNGMKILIREGSAAKNYDALHSLITSNPKNCMFCSDDKHPDNLLIGHINELVNRSLDLGYDLFDVLTIASKNPTEHYNLPIGLLRIGDSADWIISNSIENITINETYIKGKLVAQDGFSLLEYKETKTDSLQVCNRDGIITDDIAIQSNSCKVNVIHCIPGQLITNSSIEEIISHDGFLRSDINRDILKIVVVNRYNNAKPAIGFIQGFGLKKGAIASTIAHDSHNLIAVGADDNSIVESINKLIECKGGIAFTDDITTVLPLDIAGLMSSKSGEHVAKLYSEIDELAKSAGCNGPAPYMALSFMALLVIPALKMSDKGLFDGNSFSFTPLIVH